MLEDKLKKAMTELLMLVVLEKRECYIRELTSLLSGWSGGAISIQFPYAAVNRLLDKDYIAVRIKPSPDGRRRQYFMITEKGKMHLRDLLAKYRAFISSVTAILEETM